MKQRKLLQRFTACVVVAALGLGLAVPAAARETAVFNAWPQDVPQEVRTAWQALDPAAEAAKIGTQIEALAALMDAGESEEAIASRYEKLDAAWSDLLTQLYFVQWAYYRDPVAVADDYLNWMEQAMVLQSAFQQFEKDMLEKGYRDLMVEMFGEDYVEALETTPTMSDEQLALSNEEARLMNVYNEQREVLIQTLSYSFNGTDYTLASAAEANANGDLDERAYFEVMAALNKQGAEAMAPIYLDLLDVRTQLAQSQGYDNYAAYSFATTYGRDYSPQEGLAFCREVIDKLGDLEMRLVSLPDPDLDIVAAEKALITPMDADALVEKVQPYMDKVSSEYADLYQYMVDNHLYDGENLDTKVYTAYTQELPTYGSAHIMAHPDYNNVNTLVHEFGHFAEFCLAKDAFPCYDTMEIHSQGLETLYMSFVEALVGDDLAASGRGVWLQSLMGSALVVGAGMAEAELQFYMMESPTLEDVNAAWNTVANKLGLPEYYWWQIPHFFTQPCYYISYPLSCANAVELLLMAEEDFDAAADTYLDLVAQTDVQGYVNAVEQAGLTNMLSGGAVDELAVDLEDYINREIWEIQTYNDVADSHWAYEDIMDAAVLKWMIGEPGGTFAPERIMKGKELSAVMERVAEHTLADDLAPNEPVSREDLADMLYRSAQALGLDTSQRVDLGGYKDAAGISADKRDAVAWAIAEGLLVGTDADTFSPQTGVTRAQAAAVATRFSKTLVNLPSVESNIAMAQAFAPEAERLPALDVVA